MLLEKITDLDKVQLFLNLENLEVKYKSQLDEYISRYNSWEPIEYILEKAEFYWLDFFVDSRVLIPRNDTEIMVEQVLFYIFEKTILIDVWTGSSCIPISILNNLNKTNKSKIIKTYVVDISKKALEVSSINIKKYNLENNITQIESNLLSNLKLDNSAGCIIITANLPYIKNRDFENINKEVVKFEPDLALYWWEKTGFELYEKLVFQILELKNKKTILFIEIGFDQKEIAISFFKKLKLKYEIFKDNKNINRCVKVYF